jgi:hypothetical protein
LEKFQVSNSMFPVARVLGQPFIAIAPV